MITPLPSAPLPTDSASVFNSKAFALVGALNNFVDDANALATDVETNSASTADSEAAAADSATKANASATSASASAALATTKATSASASATSASASATSASSSATNAHNSEVSAANSAVLAASAVAATNMPSSLIGQSKKVLKVKVDESGYELVSSAALPRIYGFALSSDGSELLFTDANTGDLDSSSFISWFVGENLSFSVNNNQLVMSL